ncbi:MAG: hypothetical protein JXQ72_15525 [Anaerolineae bacterium]|nr:hypothetical protein [Anaerolineae bacterium]
MPFDIHVNPLGPGEDNEAKRKQYRTELIERFKESPEGRALREEHIGISWADSLVEFGLRFLSITPPEMEPADLRNILYKLFPHSVMELNLDADQAFKELRAFWAFLKREFDLNNADACRNALNDRCQTWFEQEMFNPAKFSPSKTILMMGAIRGFDVMTQEGINAWVRIYNAEQMNDNSDTTLRLRAEIGPDAAQARGQVKGAMRKSRRKKARVTKQDKKKSEETQNHDS